MRALIIHFEGRNDIALKKTTEFKANFGISNKRDFENWKSSGLGGGRIQIGIL